MRTLTLRQAVVAAALPLALASLTACGSDSSRATATDPQAGSGSAPTSGSASPAAPKKIGSADFLSVVQKATQQITTARFVMRMDDAGQSIPIRGVIDMTGDSPAMQMTVDLSGMGTPSDMRLVDRVIYVGVPGAHGRFYKVDLSDPNGPLASLGGTLDNLQPGSFMSRMSPRMFKTVTDHGVVTVGGHQVHHYTAIVDVRAESRLAKLPNLPSMPRLPRTATYDVWLDDHGRMARFRMLLKNAMTMSASYSDYGTAPHVTAPPAAAVMALPGSTTTG